MNKEQKKAYQHAWYLKNKEAHLARSRARHLAERQKAEAAAQARKESHRLASKRYYAKQKNIKQVEESLLTLAAIPNLAKVLQAIVSKGGK